MAGIWLLLRAADIEMAVEKFLFPFATGEWNIHLLEVKNLGDRRAVVKYGNQPNTYGPKRNGFSVVLPRRGVNYNTTMGGPDNPFIFETSQKGRYSWRIYDDNWKLHLSVSISGSAVQDIGRIQILHKRAEFIVWMCGDHIIIESGNDKLGREGDETQFKYFIVTENKIEGRNTNDAYLQHGIVPQSM